MNVELTETLKGQVLKLAAAQLVAEFRPIAHNQGLIDEIRNKAATKLAEELTGEFHKRVNTEQMIQAALDKFQAKVDARFEKLLSQGVNIKLGE